jgi:hypothetical protein
MQQVDVRAVDLRRGVIEVRNGYDFPRLSDIAQGQ